MHSILLLYSFLLCFIILCIISSIRTKTSQSHLFLIQIKSIYIYIHSTPSIIAHDVSTTGNNRWHFTHLYLSKVLEISYISTLHSIQPDQLFLHILVVISHIVTLYHYSDAGSPYHMNTRYHPHNAVSPSGLFVLKLSNPLSLSIQLKLTLI